MGILIAIVVSFFVLLGMALVFLRADPGKLARATRALLPMLLAIMGFAILAFGHSPVGGVILFAALAWYGSLRVKRGPNHMTRPPALVRTAAIEMELDPRTGQLEGLVLAGRHDAKVLSAMGLDELIDLYRELVADPESRTLLEAYLDSRFPVWRHDLEANSGRRLGIAPGSGSMTKEEAYEVLGLEAGAAASDIRKAHRRLMQRLHPDVGDGISVLAARINKAKDVLLSDHE